MKIRRREFTAALLAGVAIPANGPEDGLFETDHEGQRHPSSQEPICPDGHLRFQILGSSAGKPIPRPSCVCPACTQARTKGGRNYRTRTSMNIYGPGDALGRAKYRVDLSPDFMHHLIRYRLDETTLEHLLFTHSHDDHCHPDYLGFRSSAVSEPEKMPLLHVYGGSDVQEALTRRVDFEKCRIHFHRFDPFQQMPVGNVLTVHSLRANHGLPTFVNYVVQGEGLTILLAWDTGLWSEETWQFAARFRFDAVFMECTVAGPNGKGGGAQHLNPQTFLEMKRRMAELRLVEPKTPFIAVHIGDNGRLGHEQLQEFWMPKGVTVGYDGLLMELSPESSRTRPHHRQSLS